MFKTEETAIPHRLPLFAIATLIGLFPGFLEGKVHSFPNIQEAQAGVGNWNRESDIGHGKART